MNKTLLLYLPLFFITSICGIDPEQIETIPEIAIDLENARPVLHGIDYNEGNFREGGVETDYVPVWIYENGIRMGGENIPVYMLEEVNANDGIIVYRIYENGSFFRYRCNQRNYDNGGQTFKEALDYKLEQNKKINT